MEKQEARGIILGYEVTVIPTKQPGMSRKIKIKDQKAILEVAAEDYDLTVMAYNAAGQSPSTTLRIIAGVFQSELFSPITVKNNYFRTKKGDVR